MSQDPFCLWAPPCDARDDTLLALLETLPIGRDVVAAECGRVEGVDTSYLVQIDHVVALNNAWVTGAQQISQENRMALANDPLNLLAVDGPTNGSKGAGDAATWLPANTGFRCEYVARQISVKAVYALWVAPAERDAMARILSSCPDQPAYASGYDAAPVIAAPAPDPAPAPAPVEEAPAVEDPEPAPQDVYYENCTAAREAGAAPVRTGDPGYASHLDRDGDGVGCE
ncbi:DUF1524 domain-containing protein [Microbacterium sp. CBS5P-1]|nr:DUF1524 domain-containing protein [Microbacterium excoecariae]